MRKVAAVAKFQVLSRNMSEETEENHAKLQLEQPVSGPRPEPGTSRIRRSLVHDVGS
jgi:hypothetical protein